MHAHSVAFHRHGDYWALLRPFPRLTVSATRPHVRSTSTEGIGPFGVHTLYNHFEMDINEPCLPAWETFGRVRFCGSHLFPKLGLDRTVLAERCVSVMASMYSFPDTLTGPLLFFSRPAGSTFRAHLVGNILSSNLGDGVEYWTGLLLGGNIVVSRRRYRYSTCPPASLFLPFSSPITFSILKPH